MGTLRKMGAFLGLVPDDHQRYDRDGGYPQDGGYDQAGHDGAATAGDRATYDGAAYDGASYDGATYDGATYDGATYDGGTYDGATYDDPAHAGASRPSSYGSTPYVADTDTDADPRYGDAVPSHAYAGGSAQHDAEGVDHQSDVRAPHGGVRQPLFASAGRSSRSTVADSPQADYRTQGALAVQPEPRVEAAAIVEPATHQKPATVSLTGFADAREVGEFYRRGQAVILDMTDLTDAEARRMVDFAAGLAFAVRGSIDKVTTKVFMLHPPADADR